LFSEKIMSYNTRSKSCSSKSEKLRQDLVKKYDELIKSKDEQIAGLILYCTYFFNVIITILTGQTQELAQLRKENETYKKRHDFVNNTLQEYYEQKRIDDLKWEEIEREKEREREEKELEILEQERLIATREELLETLEREKEREREEKELEILEQERLIAKREELLEELKKKDALIREKKILEIKQKWKREGDVAIEFDRKRKKQCKMIRKAGYCDFVISL